MTTFYPALAAAGKLVVPFLPGVCVLGGAFDIIKKHNALEMKSLSPEAISRRNLLTGIALTALGAVGLAVAALSFFFSPLLIAPVILTCALAFNAAASATVFIGGTAYAVQQLIHKKKINQEKELSKIAPQPTIGGQVTNPKAKELRALKEQVQFYIQSLESLILLASKPEEASKRIQLETLLEQATQLVQLAETTAQQIDVQSDRNDLSQQAKKRIQVAKTLFEKNFLEYANLILSN